MSSSRARQAAVARFRAIMLRGDGLPQSTPIRLLHLAVDLVVGLVACYKLRIEQVAGIPTEPCLVAEAHCASLPARSQHLVKRFSLRHFHANERISNRLL